MGGPDIPELMAAAKDVIRKAKIAGILGTITPRIVRGEVEKLFSLKQGFLGEGAYKKSIKFAIDEAVEEEMGPESPEPPTRKQTTKKRKLEDIDANVEKPQEKSKPARSKGKAPAKGSKESGKFKSPVEVPESGSEGEASAPPSSSPKRGEVSIKKPKPPSPEREVKDGDMLPNVKGDTKDASDSEMSVLLDEPPKPKRAKKEPSKSKKTTQRKASASKLSKDEETIKRLKSLVVACGVRKVWSKVFQDIDQPSGQIRKLKEILTDLGMSGRMSIEQAKAIRERRELAQEMVFREGGGREAGRGTKSKLAETKNDSVSEPESDASEDVPRAKRKGTARRSIMDFLGDQSEED
ncbi:hypothetical protein BD779DRAFT_1798825 [Infundibulicybe gibba]|nr:hypothetical protein BD779DRAFT_1798825 [Infundibulicybe gibba]